MKKLSATLSLLAVAAALPSDAHAMHISEGILPGGWASFWYVACAPFVLYAIVKLKRTVGHGYTVSKPLIGMVGAAVFIISCMPIPVPIVGSCSHPAGTALAAILIGPSLGILAAFCALLLQALFLAHGGITTLGANTISMGVMGCLSGYLAFVAFRRLGAPVFLAAFIAGVAGDWGTYATTSLELSLALHSPGGFWGLFATIAAAFAPTQIPLGIAEGFMTAFAVRFVLERRPEIVSLASGTYKEETSCA